MAYTPEQRLAAARNIIRKRAPWLSVPILKLVFRAAPGLGTFGTSARGIVSYDPAKCEEWSPEVSTGGAMRLDAEKLAGVVAHEMCHVLFRHFERGPKLGAKYGLSALEMNVIGDLSINEAVKSMGLQLPADAVFPATFGLPPNLTMDEYCQLWPKRPLQGGFPGGGQGGGDPQDGPPQNGQGRVTRGHCGGCAGHAVEGEADADDAEARSDAAWQEAAETAAAAYSQSHQGQGTGSGELQRWAEERLRPARVPWQDKLRRVVRRARQIAAGKDRLNFERPSIYQSALGYGLGRPVAPRRVSYLPNIAVAVDTSGSMGSEVFTAILSEIDGILASVPQKRAMFFACDARVNAEIPVSSAREAGRHLRGGGGTDFRPVFERIAAYPRETRPDVLIFATDGWGDAPAEAPPGMSVIWLIVPDGKAPAPWGEVVPLTWEDLEQ